MSQINQKILTNNGIQKQNLWVLIAKVKSKLTSTEYHRLFGQSIMETSNSEGCQEKMVGQIMKSWMRV